jgi:predicted ArsR family transcriptional regulator
LEICRIEAIFAIAMDASSVLRALSDDTRAALYRELATSTRALSAGDLAERLGLHANTVRTHLERMRDAGIVDVESEHRGTVGRPQHVYSLCATSPGLAFDPPAHALLAGLLAGLAERSGAMADDAIAVGRSWGRDSAHRARTRSCIRALTDEMARLGFDPDGSPTGTSTRAGAREGVRDGEVSLAFLHCPFRELAEAYPELVCNLHRGICEGIIDAVGGGNVDDFSTLYDHRPCEVTVAIG